MARDFYKLSEAAKLLGIQTRTLREWIRAKPQKVKAYKYEFSPVWFVSKEEIERLKSEMKQVGGE